VTDVAGKSKRLAEMSGKKSAHESDRPACPLARRGNSACKAPQRKCTASPTANLVRFMTFNSNIFFNL